MAEPTRDQTLPHTAVFQNENSMERPPSPAASIMSMRSDNSMGYRPNLREQDDSTKERPPSPAPSMMSMRSDNSMGYRPNLREQDNSTKESNKRPTSPAPSMLSMRSDNSMGYRPNLREQDDSTKERPPSPAPSMMSIRSDNSMGYRPNLREQDDSMTERPPSPAPSMVSMRSDNSMGYRPNLREQDDSMTERHQPKHVEVQEKLERINEQCMKSKSAGSTQQNRLSSLTNMYTDLIITEGRELEVNCEHEIRQIEILFRRAATQDTTINCRDLFKPLPGQQKHIRTVLTNGIAGIGKTVTVEKFILDWPENEANQDIQLIILLPFKELNVFKRKLISLTELLEHFCKARKDICSMLSNSNVLLILDGLDESRIQLDFTSKEMCHDTTQLNSVDVLLTNLIKRNLLPSALLWITTRPAAASQIPPEFIDRVTDIRGFNDLQKEEYFRKRISDENLANRIITHLKSSRSLYIMCYIPVFCWIAATVLEILLSEAQCGKIPKTLTQMYIQFLITQTNVKKKYTVMKEKDEEMIFKLGKLAFHQLEKGNLIFYEDDLEECGIDMKEASVYSGMCTQIFREEYGTHKGKIFCFVHLSIQEFLAALYAHISFHKDKINVFESNQTIAHRSSFKDLHEEVVNRALQSPNGHLDLFLRFLLGLSTRSNQRLLKTLLPRIGQSIKSRSQTVKYLKQKIKENPLPEKSINLFHCLNELSYQPLIEEVKAFLHSKILHKIKLSIDHWAALVFVLFTSENDLDVFDLSQYMGSNEALQMLLPVVKVAKRLLITQCNLTEKSCEKLADVLQSKLSTLQELDLSGSQLQLRGVKLLCSALGSEDCNLEKLRWNGCKLNEESCDAVVSAFNSNSASLRELDMSGNQLNDSVVKKLSETLKTQKCKLEVLRLKWCGVTQEGFRDLTSALQANPSHLKELDLSMNTSGDAEVLALCEVLNQPLCRLEVLKLNKCELTHDCCSSLKSIISSESSSLLELHLSDNKLHDAGVERLAAGLEKAHCKLEVLKLCNCSVSVKGCGFLAMALRRNPSHLRELYLNWNHPKDSGANPLTELLDSRPPDLRLEKLDINPPAMDPISI